MSRKRKAGALAALAAMRQVAKGSADGAAENDEAMGRRDRQKAADQPFFLADILRMVDDAEREVLTDPVPEPVRSSPVTVLLEAGGLSQSFSILPGNTVQVTLVGYIDDDTHRPRRLTVPVTLALRTA